MADPHLDIDIDSMGLRRGLDRLPQELWDQIYTEVFTAPPGNRLVKRVCYKPGSKHSPSEFKLLQVSSATRALFAKTYYGQVVTYQVNARYYRPFRSLWGELVAWLQLLPVHHRDLVEKIIIVPVPEKKRGARPDVKSHLKARSMREYVARELDTNISAKVFLKVSGRLYSGR